MGYFSQDKSSRNNGHGNGIGEAKVKEAAAGKNPGDTVSTLGIGMLITGNMVCEGTAQIFGGVIGDIQAKQITIGEGGQVEGNIAAHDVAISGTFKGTIRGYNVRLKDAAMVDGEIFSKSLTVEENVRFEGVSRRLEESIELPSSAQVSPLTTTPITMLETAPISVPVA